MTIGITLTGADERTPVADLIHLADLGAEIGLLYTCSPDGRHRYPSRQWIVLAAAALEGRAALHVCGNRARTELCEHGLTDLLGLVGRVQVNGLVSPEALKYLLELVMPYDSTLITQHRPENLAALDAAIITGCVYHALLVDGSGGRGILPDAWVRPPTSKPVGFAGGLGPDTLRRELPRIAAVAHGEWWVDMEGRLRDDDDWFDLAKAKAAMGVWREFVAGLVPRSA